MRLYSTYKSIPELAGLSQLEQRQIWRRCVTRAFGRPQTWLGFGLFALWSTAVGIVVVPLLERYLPAYLRDAALFFFGPIIAAIGVLIPSYIMQTIARRYVREEIPTLCNFCAYDLTGNVSGACPECGAAIIKRRKI